MINRLKENEKAAFEELVALHKNSVINTCYRFLLNQEDAEDISQEVFIEIYQSISSFRGDAKLSTWIYRITVTKCLDEIKKRNRKKRISSLGKLLHIDTIIPWIAGDSMPDKALQEEERFREISTVLNTLPENQRVAFTLSKIEGFTNKEIAEIMNTTTIAVESLIHRAKKKTAEELTTILKNKDT
ncbi:RNA polymerase sigma factor [Flavobacterium sp. N1994]|uniref:RNA polymerase sigma factor n=1 Tax=Flavobacterium sp. N1994 TaxID=2986827 RepID=UPI0022225E9A|nr:RNA polymerase sigma factor [Flavobacterium sp. N1994]